MTDLTTFKNDNFGEVRTVMRDGEPWFVAADVCRSLEIGNPAMAMRRLDEDEHDSHSIDTPGGKQGMNIVNEAGLYRLVLCSRTKKAYNFKRWITHDVLPSIRKNRKYVKKDNTETAKTIWKEFISATDKGIPGKVHDYLGYIYVLEYGTTIKIGSTRNPEKRLKNLEANARLYGDISTGRVLVSIPHVNFRENETLIHRYLREMRITSSERFDITFDEWFDWIPYGVEFDTDVEVYAAEMKRKWNSLMSAAGLNINGGDNKCRDLN